MFWSSRSTPPIWELMAIFLWLTNSLSGWGFRPLHSMQAWQQRCLSSFKEPPCWQTQTLKCFPHVELSSLPFLSSRFVFWYSIILNCSNQTLSTVTKLRNKWHSCEIVITQVVLQAVNNIQKTPASFSKIAIILSSARLALIRVNKISERRTESKIFETKPDWLASNKLFTPMPPITSNHWLIKRKMLFQNVRL